MWPGGGSKRGSQFVRTMEEADRGAGAGVGAGGMTLPGPPSPTTKKAPRTDYDKASLDLSPRLEQAVTGDAIFAYQRST